MSGAVVIDGSSTVEPLSSAAAELFMEENPDANVTVGTSGTGGGFEKFCAGETDISDASRPIKESEIEKCKQNNIQYSELIVANDALSVVVNPQNNWAELPDRRAAEEDVGARLDGQQLEPGRSGVPERAVEALRGRLRLGHLRLLHPGHQR